MRTDFTQEVRDQAREAVAAIEAETAAEVVVVVRPASAAYREADYLWGFVLAEIFLLLILFLPQEFPLETIAIDVAIGFIVGALVSWRLPPLRRLVTSERRRREATLAAARSCFVERGVTQTRGRNGLLVYASVFEGRVEIVCDSGIDADSLPTIEIDDFLAGLRALAAPLAAEHPRLHDDVNELDDAVTR